MTLSEPAQDFSLKGRRVLVVEDEATISLLLEDMLLDFGCEVVGPAGRLPTALRLVEAGGIDVAILDVNVAGEPIYPVADALAAQGVPLIFSTGYGSGGIDGPYRDHPMMGKPFSQADLERMLKVALDSA